MEHYVNIMLDGGFKAVFGDKQVAMDLPYDLPSGRDRSWLEGHDGVRRGGGGKKGKAEGERLATLRNARNMKKAGVDLSLIAECTGLSLEIIQSLWSDKPVADWNYSGWHGSWGEVSFLIRAIRIWSNIRLMRLTPH